MIRNASFVLLFCCLTAYGQNASTERNASETGRKSFRISGYERPGDETNSSAVEDDGGVLERWMERVTGLEKDTSKAKAVAWMECFAMTAEKTNKAVQVLLRLFTDGPLADGPEKLVTFVSGSLSALSQGLGLAGAVLNYVLSFFLPTELDVIRNEFRRVSTKLDDLTQKLDDTASQIEAAVEFSSWMTQFVAWRYAIRNAGDKLDSLMERIRTAPDPGDKARYAEEFVRYFEENDVEGAADSVHRVAGVASTTASTNLFSLYSRRNGPYPRELAKLMLLISDVMISAAKQAMTYYAFREGTSRAEEAYIRHQELLDDVRIQYELHLWYIMRDIKKHVIDAIRNATDDVGEHVEDDEIAEGIEKMLSYHYDWYSWAVVVTGEHGLCTSGSYETRGDDYVFLRNLGPNKDKNVLVVWQHIGAKAASCGDVMDGDTIVFLADTDGRSPHRVASNGRVLNSATCWPSRQRVQDRYLGQSQPYDMPQWIATPRYSENAACEDKAACSGHGRCLVVPSTAYGFCICENGYRGDDCETRANPEAEKAIVSLLASLRLSYGDASHVPTLSETREAIDDLDDQMEAGREKITDILDYLKSLINNGEVLNKAQYIKTRYRELIKGDITQEIFGRYMDDFLRTESIDYILVELQNTLLGIGLLDGKNGDILTTFKKSYLAHSGASAACTENYASSVYKMIKKLTGLDKTVSEAMIWYVKWKLEDSPEAAQDTILNDAYGYVADAQSRHQAYVNTWHAESCPELNVSGLIQNYCGGMLSYEGLVLDLQCDDDQLRPIPAQIRCTNNGTNLVWSEMPKCDYVWAEWSQWSSCDRSCGGGNKIRTRRKTNGETVKEQKRCQLQDCCQAIDNKRACLSGECISLDQECDGRLDCADGGDELTCDYLRSGDTVSLETVCGGYLNCYCTHHSCGWWFWKKDSCKADADNDYSKFIIINHNKNNNNNNNNTIRSAIHHGDTVSFRYRHLSEQWLSCPVSGKACALSSCSGSSGDVDHCPDETFRIFAPDRRASCQPDSSQCLGQPIRARDTVYIERSRSHWLSGKKNEAIFTTDCPGLELNSADTQCSCEIWMIHDD